MMIIENMNRSFNKPEVRIAVVEPAEILVRMQDLQAFTDGTIDRARTDRFLKSGFADQFNGFLQTFLAIFCGKSIASRII